MDLQSINLTGGKRGSLAKLTVLFCFGLACALLIGSLIAPAANSSRIGSSAASSSFHAPA